jgi:hypothetical protein
MAEQYDKEKIKADRDKALKERTQRLDERNSKIIREANRASGHNAERKRKEKAAKKKPESIWKILFG